MKPGPNQERWLSTLESTELPQGQGRLQLKGGYCCLGIACLTLADDSELDYTGLILTGCCLDKQPVVRERLGLFSSCGEVRAGHPLIEPALEYLDTIRPDARQGSTFNALALTSLNDDFELSFAEIAAFVRKFPELYFTEPR